MCLGKREKEKWEVYWGMEGVHVYIYVFVCMEFCPNLVLSSAIGSDL